MTREPRPMPVELLAWIEGVPADPAEWRTSFDARLRHAFSHGLSLKALANELHAMVFLHAPRELVALASTCLCAVARTDARDGLSFALLRAVRDVVLIGR